MKKVIIGLLFFSIIFSVDLSAQVVINEYSAANLEGILDNYNRTEDWIELYNTSSSEINLSGFHLSDKATKPAKWEIPEGTIIPGKGFLIFWCSGRDEYCPDNYHTNFKLTQTKDNEILLLTNQSEEILDEIKVEVAPLEGSIGRNIDGGGNWLIYETPTLGESNDASPKASRFGRTPSMNMAAGYYTDFVNVEITNNEELSTLRYTTNGTNPTENSTIYSGPINITSTTILKAASFSDDPMILPSRIEFNTYFINEDFTLAVFSVGANDVVELANGSGDLIPIGSIEYFNKDKEREATSFGSLNRHGQDSWVLNHRSLDWVSRDEMGYSKAIEAQLFSYSDRDEYQKFMFRNSGDDNYPAINDNEHFGSTHIRDEYVQTLASEGGLKLDHRAVERVILFLNGQYWGVYGLRDRPVDHDYTKEYYDQGKYDIQYLTTWGDTEIQYGGQEALNDWYRLRNFILENDMSDESNYVKVTDELNVTSLIDYMIVNLNSVASDWLNYNTGWWRGTDPEGDHKKWGYILWDLDATFDYYINYSGVPNISPDAQPCDIEDISDFMDQFFGENGGGSGPGGNSCAVMLDASQCQSITDGTSPYPATDEVFQKLVNQDSRCCAGPWDEVCENQYQSLLTESSFDKCPSIENGTCPYPYDDPLIQEIFVIFGECCEVWGEQCQDTYDFFEENPSFASLGIRGNVGMHEKIFLKLQEENPDFRQLYYSRQADLMNTVYSCENMMSTLDRMLAVIEPEMPRQIQRWGGSLTQWESNVDRLKNFINQRCELFDDGMIGCYGLQGPYQLTLMVRPEGVGEIDLNTLDIETFPWTGEYFGGMENKIKAKAFEDEYEFSHWESTNGNTIFPDDMSRIATISLTQADTLTGVFKLSTNTNDVAESLKLKVYPNPNSGTFVLSYALSESQDVTISLSTVLGQSVKVFGNVSGHKVAGQHFEQLDLKDIDMKSGMYLLKVKSKDFESHIKISIQI